jgi:ABC-type transport system involved in multi-copper enzyme maturation permease subunit
VDDLREDARGAFIIARKEFYFHLRSLRLILFGAMLSVVVLLFALVASTQQDVLTQGINAYAPDAILFAVNFVFGLLSSMIALVIAYDDMTRERVGRSLDLLLVKPVNYNAIVLGKFLGTFSAMALPITVVTLGSVAIISLTSRQSPTVVGTLGFLFCLFISVSICILMQQTLSMVFKTSTTALLVGIIIIFFFMIFWQSMIDYISTSMGLRPDLVALPEQVLPLLNANDMALKERTEAFMEWISLLNPFPSLGYSSAFLSSMGVFLMSGESFVTMPRLLPPAVLLLWLLFFFFLATLAFRRMVRKL